LTFYNLLYIFIVNNSMPEWRNQVTRQKAAKLEIWLPFGILGSK